MIGINKNTKFDVSEITLGNAYTILGRENSQNDMVILRNDNNKLNSYPADWFDILDDDKIFLNTDEVGYASGSNTCGFLVKELKKYMVGTFCFRHYSYSEDHLTIGREYILEEDKNYSNKFRIKTNKGDITSFPKEWFDNVKEIELGLGSYKIIPFNKMTEIVIDGIRGYLTSKEILRS